MLKSEDVCEYGQLTPHKTRTFTFNLQEVERTETCINPMAYITEAHPEQHEHIVGVKFWRLPVLCHGNYGNNTNITVIAILMGNYKEFMSWIGPAPSSKFSEHAVTKLC